MKNVYFIGIGGIGMSAIARYYKFKGLDVSGYDRTPSELTHKLEAEGIRVHYEDRPDLVPSDKEETLVVYTPAIPQDLGELRKVMDEGYTVLKRSRTLGEITRGQRCLAVAGTHGKTTTSTLTAHILTQTGAGCSAFLGGISRNYGTNLLMSRNETVVVEAFRAFASQVSGTLIVKKGAPVSQEHTQAKVLTYHYKDTSADFYAADAHPDALGHFHYNLHYPGGVIQDICVGALGWVNAENSIAAAAIALTYGVDPEGVKAAIGTFEGVKRRLEVHVNTPALSYIDDYAHHPSELTSAITSMRDIFPGRKLTAIFQPHLYTRTRDFAPEFAKALSAVDKLILLEIYPAREEPIPGVTSEMVFRDVTAPEKVLLKKEELMDYLADEPLDVLATFGAGNIDRFIEPITELLKSRL